MEFLYCFANVSLTQRILDYLLKQMTLWVDSVTVIFLNDRWVMHLKINSAVDANDGDNCWAFLMENGIPYQPTAAVAQAIHDLEAGCPPTQVMNRLHLPIVSHGMPNLEEVPCFRQQFVEGLGYCPQAFG
ncbi:MAG: hypothetical protein WBA57_17510 [Elainellaceae cyanobacterium]